MKTTPNPYSGYRYPVEIIIHAVWLYFRFTLSYRDVEEILAARGIVVSYEAVRQWCLKFGQQYANKLRRRRGNLGDTWFLLECRDAQDAKRDIQVSLSPSLITTAYYAPAALRSMLDSTKRRRAQHRPQMARRRVGCPCRFSPQATG